MSPKVPEKSTSPVFRNGSSVASGAAGVSAPENAMTAENGEIAEIEEILEIIEDGSAHLGEIRKIIVAPETVGEVLPAAIKKSIEHGKHLSEATLTITESNIRESVRRDPRILTEAIFPIIMSAIVESISKTLEQMVQSLNQTLEQSLTVKGLRWRVEAWRTGKDLGEVVMLNTLLYRVEQVFLIHKDTGILLRHVSAQAEQTGDAEMVSGMLTAIQDFVQDSFQNTEDATLDSLKVRDLSVWLEYSREAILAVVIRGSAPLAVREVLTDAIDRVSFNYETELAQFAGETEHFEPSGIILEDCLLQQKEQAGNLKLGIFSPLNIIGAAAILLVLIGGFFSIRDYRRWSDYLERLRGEDGIVVTESNRGFFFGHEIAGLRSVGAVHPEDLLSEYGYDKKNVESHWKIFHDLNPKIVLERANKILKPPPTAVLSLEDGVLTVRGTASLEWLLEARELSQSIAGIDGFKVER